MTALTHKYGAPLNISVFFYFLLLCQVYCM
uniref:Uncharacterized protein n=1 Tax=Anguilla anguilla TaxID=7936 RepID=A0A0E9TG19_ANGAN